MNVSSLVLFPTTSLICQPTGPSKTHAVQIFGTVCRGILLIIVTSLALAKDLVGKYVSEYNNTIYLIYLDKIERDHNAHQLISDATSALLSVRCNDDVFIPIATSPQTLAKPNWVNFFIDKPIVNNTLSGIVLDEVQLFVEFRCHFRPEFPALKRILFDKINTGTRTINAHDFVVLKCSVIITTATFDNTNVMSIFCRMTGLHLPPPTWLWAPASDMHRHDLNLKFQFSSDFIQISKTRLRTYFKHNDAEALSEHTQSDVDAESNNDTDPDSDSFIPAKKAIIYTNSLVSADVMKVKLDEWLDDTDTFYGDIMTFTGNLFPEQKFERASVFAERVHLQEAMQSRDPCPRLAITTPWLSYKHISQAPGGR